MTLNSFKYNDPKMIKCLGFGAACVKHPSVFLIKTLVVDLERYLNLSLLNSSLYWVVVEMIEMLRYCCCDMECRSVAN